MVFFPFLVLSFEEFSVWRFNRTDFPKYLCMSISLKHKVDSLFDLKHKISFLKSSYHNECCHRNLFIHLLIAI